MIIISCKDEPKQKTNNEKNTTISKQEDDTKISTSDTGVKLTSLDLALEVEKFISCKKINTKRNDCRNSITKTISKTFGLPEFKDPEGGYFVYDSIRPIAERSKKWLKLGTIDQKNLDMAIAHTNRNGLALVIDTSETYGHVVMIVSGESKKSGSWNMKLPNVLSLSNYKPEKSFSNKSLAYAMKKSNDLKVFIRQ